MVGNKLIELTLHGFRDNFLFFLLCPADVCSPERKTIGDEHVEQADVHGEPIIKKESLGATSITSKEYHLSPDHGASHQEVVSNHTASDSSNQTTTVDVVQ